MNSFDYIAKHTKLLKQCGAWATARYLQKREYTLGQALALLGFPNRFNVA